MITGGDLRQSRLDVGYKTFTISPCIRYRGLNSFIENAFWQSNYEKETMIIRKATRMD